MVVLCYHRVVATHHNWLYVVWFSTTLRYTNQVVISFLNQLWHQSKTNCGTDPQTFVVPILNCCGAILHLVALYILNCCGGIPQLVVLYNLYPQLLWCYSSISCTICPQLLWCHSSTSCTSYP